MKFITQLNTFRSWLLTAAVEWIKPAYAVLFQRDKTPWHQTLDQLRQYPPGSLGRELAQFLDTHGLCIIPLYENHDVYHVLFGYDAEVSDEAAMQFFLLGNRKWTPSVLITVLFSVLILPECYRKFLREYRRGRQCLPVAKWAFQHLLHEPVEMLQRQLFRRSLQAPFIL